MKAHATLPTHATAAARPLPRPSVAAQAASAPAASPFDAFAFVDEGGTLVAASGDTYLECAYLSDASGNAVVDRLDVLACGLHGELLCDALCGWDMEDGQWISDSPLLLRFDETDVVLEPLAGGGLRIWRGVMDDRDGRLLPDASLPTGRHLGSGDRGRAMRERCLRAAGEPSGCWVPYSPLFSLMGTSTTLSTWEDLVSTFALGTTPPAGERSPRGAASSQTGNEPLGAPSHRTSGEPSARAA